MPQGCLQFVIVVFPDYTHLLFTGMGLKHWVLLHIEFSTMFFLTKFSNCLALIVLLGLYALRYAQCWLLVRPLSTPYTETSASVDAVSLVGLVGPIPGAFL